MSQVSTENVTYGHTWATSCSRDLCRNRGQGSVTAWPAAIRAEGTCGLTAGTAGTTTIQKWATQDLQVWLSRDLLPLLHVQLLNRAWSFPKITCHSKRCFCYVGLACLGGIALSMMDLFIFFPNSVTASSFAFPFICTLPAPGALTGVPSVVLKNTCFFIIIRRKKPTN